MAPVKSDDHATGRTVNSVGSLTAGGYAKTHIGDVNYHFERSPLIDLPTAHNAAFDCRDEEHNARCHPDTRIDLLRQIYTWANDPDGKCIFWLNGVAGTGKSTISRTVAGYFKERGVLGASFFFKRGERDRGNAALFFTTLAAQLVSRESQMLPFVREALDSDPAIATKALREQFEKLILQPLGQFYNGSQDPRTITMVIDALDECDYDNDTRLIIHLFSQANALGSIRLRVFITSRPELPIRLGFKDIRGKYQDVALHQIPEAVIEHDIAAYLRHELARIREDYNSQTFEPQQLSPNWPDEHIHTLVRMANPLFIFAATLCRFIADETWLDPEAQLAKVLDQRSSDSELDKLDSTYLPVLDQLVIGETGPTRSRLMNEFRVIVGPIVLLAEPLSALSLSHLLNVPVSSVTRTLSRLHAVLDVPLKANALIRPFHLSFRDFLVDPGKRDTNPFWVDDRATHERIATGCLELLSSSGHLRKDICNLKMLGIARAEVEPALIESCLPVHVRYACLHWIYHLKRSNTRITDNHEAYLFLKAHILHWLEALSLLGKISESITMIRTLQTLGRADNSADVSAFLHDAARFILSYRSIIDQAPLQIYTSAIVFSPEKSILRNLFEDYIPERISLTPKVDLEWDACLQTLEGHSDSVRAVGFSPDGKTLASASGDGTVRLWDAAAGAHRQTLEGHSGFPADIAFSFDGKTLALALSDSTVWLRDGTTGVHQQTLKGHSAFVQAVAFSPDDKTLASASNDCTVRLWDTITSEYQHTLEGHNLTVTTITFSSNGKTLASASCDQTIRLWNAKTGMCQRTLEGHNGTVNAVAFSPDDKTLASASDDGTVRLWDAATGVHQQTLNGHNHSVTAIAFSSNGKTLASASRDQTIRLWNAKTGVYEQTLEGHSNYVTAIAFSPNNQILVSASGDHTIRLWDMTKETHQEIFEKHNNLVTVIAFSSNSKILASASEDSNIWLWNAATGAHQHTLQGHRGPVKAITFSPDNKTLASASDDGTIRLWDATAGTYQQTLEGHSGSISTIAFSPNSKMLASASEDRTVRLWDATTGEHQQTLEAPTTFPRCSVSLYNGKTMVEVVTAIAFSPDSEMLASTSHDKSVRLWDATTGVHRQAFIGHDSLVTAIAFSPDSKTLASASCDNTVRLWDAIIGAHRRTLKGHTRSVSAVVFSSDGKTLVTASYDQTVQLWNATTGTHRQILKVDRILYTLSLDTTGSYLCTDIGTILINEPSTSNSTPIQILPHKPRYTGCGLSSDGTWITWDSENLLWIPSESRPVYSAVAQRASRVALGCSSGRVVIFGF